MTRARSNFDFLGAIAPRLVQLGALAERYFSDDAPGALLKLRQFGEFLAKDVAARHGVLPQATANFDDVLRALRTRGVLPRAVGDLLFHLKRTGNAAAHEDAGTTSEALQALKIAREVGIWFYRSYAGIPTFSAGPFVPPRPSDNGGVEQLVELERLRGEVRQSSGAEAGAKLIPSAVAVTLPSWW